MCGPILDGDAWLGQTTVGVLPRASGESVDAEAHDVAQRGELATDLFVGRAARVIDQARHPTMSSSIAKAERHNSRM
jgi:hypothetical protein